jgi:SMC interacting uncharacterized protein involved in chromosome segregation
MQGRTEAEDNLQINQETLKLITEENRQIQLRQHKWEQESIVLRQDNEDLYRVKSSLEEANKKLTSELEWKDRNYEEKFKTMRDQLSIHYQTVKKLEEEKHEFAQELNNLQIRSGSDALKRLEFDIARNRVEAIVHGEQDLKDTILRLEQELEDTHIRVQILVSKN